jgi:hypothetical protein
MLTKPELLGQFTNAKNNYVLGLAASSLFVTPEAYLLLDKSRASFGTYGINFEKVATLLRNPADRDKAVNQFVRMLLRGLIKESFELLKDYCDETTQADQFKAESWYQFARMIRNCLSHSCRFEFNPYDKTLLPVTWKSRTITLAKDGQPLLLAFFGYVEAWELFKEFYDFVDRQLA